MAAQERRARRLCHSNDTRVIAPGRSLKVARCPKCHCTLTVLNQPAVHEELNEYDVRYAADADAGKPLECWEVLSRLVDVSAGQRLLDVGCGRGGFLDAARATASIRPVCNPPPKRQSSHRVATT